MKVLLNGEHNSFQSVERRTEEVIESQFPGNVAGHGLHQMHQYCLGCCDAGSATVLGQTRRCRQAPLTVRCSTDSPI
jgi:hypothetical protein